MTGAAWRVMPFKAGGALLLAPDADSMVALGALLEWVRSRRIVLAPNGELMRWPRG